VSLAVSVPASVVTRLKVYLPLRSAVNVGRGVSGFVSGAVLPLGFLVSVHAYPSSCPFASVESVASSWILSPTSSVRSSLPARATGGRFAVVATTTASLSVSAPSLTVNVAV
jgi:hypothetical protein